MTKIPCPKCGKPLTLTGSTIGYCFTTACPNFCTRILLKVSHGK